MPGFAPQALGSRGQGRPGGPFGAFWQHGPPKSEPARPPQHDVRAQVRWSRKMHPDQIKPINCLVKMRQYLSGNKFI